jgi:hypothetical protein
MKKPPETCETREYQAEIDRHHEYTKRSGNWSAKRRRKLVRCPCGAYYDNAAVRALGLYSESEWKRKGYAKLKPGPKYYLDPETAKRTGLAVVVGKGRPVTHIRRGPRPVARVWRPFYEPRPKRFEDGIYSVDLFSVNEIDTGKFQLTREQALRVLEKMGVITEKGEDA